MPAAETYIALFRGINVGGRSTLPMKVLVECLEALGLEEVRTYIQSGNAVFRCPKTDTAALAKRMTAAVKKQHGLEPRVLVLSHKELQRAAAANPYPEAEADPKSLHLGFLEAKPTKFDRAALEHLRAESERFTLKGLVFYLHAPEGVGRSKLAGKVERILGVAMTDRNWRTVTTLIEMADATQS
jgi:uncharacterized protein (DUF1697 family)